jgi:succinyl-CoA:acetate CoA-transferase
MASSSASNRVLNKVLAQRVMSGEEAAALIQPGSQIGMSGFTGSGYPKAVPMALARKVADAHLRGERCLERCNCARRISRTRLRGS